MRDSKLARLMSVLFVGMALYICFDFHSRFDGETRGLVNTAHAGEVVMLKGRFYTTSQDGLTLNVWELDDKGNPHYLWSVSSMLKPRPR
jgi:hypothetical protein